MGAIIYITGEIETSGLTKEQSNYIQAIEDGWGYDCFKIKDNVISFINEQVEGSCPVADGVEEPLQELLSYLKKQKITLESETYITIESDCYDFNNITIVIDPKTLDISYQNTCIYFAEDQELIQALEKRGYTVSKGVA